LPEELNRFQTHITEKVTTQVLESVNSANSGEKRELALWDQYFEAHPNHEPFRDEVITTTRILLLDQIKGKASLTLLIFRAILERPYCNHNGF